MAESARTSHAGSSVFELFVDIKDYAWPKMHYIRLHDFYFRGVTSKKYVEPSVTDRTAYGNTACVVAATTEFLIICFFFKQDGYFQIIPSFMINVRYLPILMLAEVHDFAVVSGTDKKNAPNILNLCTFF